MVLIRPIAKEDEPVIAAIIRNVLEESQLDVPGTAYFDPELDYMYDYYHKLVDSAYWVVEDHGHLVGGVGIGLLSESLELPIKGHSELLTEKGEIVAAERGYNFLYLETIRRLETAIILYEKWGYRFLDEPLLPGDHTLMDTFMIKDLNAK